MIVREAGFICGLVDLRAGTALVGNGTGPALLLDEEKKRPRLVVRADAAGAALGDDGLAVVLLVSTASAEEDAAAASSSASPSSLKGEMKKLRMRLSVPKNGDDGVDSSLDLGVPVDEGSVAAVAVVVTCCSRTFPCCSSPSSPCSLSGAGTMMAEALSSGSVISRRAPLPKYELALRS